MAKIKLALVGLVLALAVSFILPGPAKSQPSGPICGERSKLLEIVAPFEEQVVLRGLFAGGSQILEVLVGPDGRSWTIFITDATGRTCVPAFGFEMEMVGPIPVEGVSH